MPQNGRRADWVKNSSDITRSGASGRCASLHSLLPQPPTPNKDRTVRLPQPPAAPATQAEEGSDGLVAPATRPGAHGTEEPVLGEDPHRSFSVWRCVIRAGPTPRGRRGSGRERTRSSSERPRAPAVPARRRRRVGRHGSPRWVAGVGRRIVWNSSSTGTDRPREARPGTAGTRKSPAPGAARRRSPFGSTPTAGRPRPPTSLVDWTRRLTPATRPATHVTGAPGGNPHPDHPPAKPPRPAGRPRPPAARPLRLLCQAE